MNNPNIAEHGKDTRFGQPGGANPSVAASNGKPWSIRNHLRLLAGREVDFDNLDEEFRIMRREGPDGKASLAKLGAIRMWERFLKKMPDAMIDKFLDNLEGKQVLSTQELPPPAPMPESFATDEEAEAFYNAHFKR